MTIKKRYHYLAIITQLVVLFSCVRDNEHRVVAYDYSLTYSKEYSFSIDAQTSSVIGNVSFFRAGQKKGVFIESRSYLSLLNSQIRAIQVYDYESGDLVHKVDLALEGPNAIVGSSKIYYHIKSLDSIYVAPYPSDLIYLVDFEGKVRARYNTDIDSRPTDFYARTGYSMAFNNNEIYSGFFTDLPGIQRKVPKDDKRLQGSLARFDLEANKAGLLHHFPVEYNQGKAYSIYYYRAQVCVNDLSDELIVGYGLSDSISVLSPDEQEQKYYAGSDIVEEIHSYNRGEAAFDHYRLNYCYESLIYDKYRNVYYRILSKPVREDNLKSPERRISRYKNINVIVLDGTFRKITEAYIPDEYSAYAFFVSEDGLHLVNTKMAYENEDQISFGVFTLSKDG